MEKRGAHRPLWKHPDPGTVFLRYGDGQFHSRQMRCWVSPKHIALLDSDQNQNPMKKSSKSFEFSSNHRKKK